MSASPLRPLASRLTVSNTIHTAMSRKSKNQADPDQGGAGLQEVRAAERRQEVVQRHFVGQVGDVHRCRDARAALMVQQVVRADAQVEHVPRFHAVGIVVVVLLAGEVIVPALRQRKQRRGHLAHAAAGAQAVGYWAGDRGKHAVACQADRYLLIRRHAGESTDHGGTRIGHPTHYQSAVIAPGESDPLVVLVLIPEYSRRLKRLVVIDPKYASSQRRSLRDESSVLGRIVSGARMAKRPIGLKALQVGGAYAPGDSIQLGVVPYDRESYGRGAQGAEVVRTVRVLPEVVCVNQQVPADRLLKASIELIPVAGLQRRAHGAEHILRQAADSGRAREQKVLVERGLQRP